MILNREAVLSRHAYGTPLDVTVTICLNTTLANSPSTNAARRPAVNFFLTLTTTCNLQCRYCYGECCDDFDDHDYGFDYDYYLPRSVSYSVEDLNRFLACSPQSAF
jgi:hypothetical protein